MAKPAPAEETENEEESPDQPEMPSTADSAEPSTSKTAGGKVSHTLLEQVWNMICFIFVQILNVVSDFVFNIINFSVVWRDETISFPFLLNSV